MTEVFIPLLMTTCGRVGFYSTIVVKSQAHLRVQLHDVAGAEEKRSRRVDNIW